MSDRNFRDLLEARWSGGNFVCVGLDSDFEKIPRSAHVEGNKCGVSVENTILNFNCQIVEATSDIVCAYKLNSAFYEACDTAGITAMYRTITYINMVAPGIPVILDAKRADIGNSNAGYVHSAFSFLRADAITVHPYLGAEALQPFLDRTDKGVIVLCRTSNPGAGELQDQKIILPFEDLVDIVGDEQKARELSLWYGWDCVAGALLPVYQYVALRVSRQWNKNKNCALVVGATYPDELRTIRLLVGDMPILIPGVGIQGGDLEKTVLAGKDSRGRGMIINSSRGIIFASKGDNFAEVARREVDELNNSINHYCS